MFEDRLTRELYAEIVKIPLIDPHSHINPHKAASRSLDDILGYHYYTELAHSAGMDQKPLGPEVPVRDRVRAILGHMDRFDSTAQYSWFLEIAQTFLGFKGNRITARDCDTLCDAADKCMAQKDWEEQVLRRSNVEKIFLTNDFDDPLQDFDTKRYIPCLRTDDLVFHLEKSEVRSRLAKATGVEVGDLNSLRQAIRHLFEHFTARVLGPVPSRCRRISRRGMEPGEDVARSLSSQWDVGLRNIRAQAVFWILAEHCRDFELPFDLMIGVNRLFRAGVYQGQDLFDQRTSLIQYQELFNAFPEVTFPISVLTSSQNQELVSYSWIFPNVITNGHWWYSNIPHYIAADTRARLQAVPKTKQVGYYSDAYKLEFILPKYNMYRRILAGILAEDFVKPGVYTEQEAPSLARLLLRENAQRIFKV